MLDGAKLYAGIQLNKKAQLEEECGPENGEFGGGENNWQVHGG